MREIRVKSGVETDWKASSLNFRRIHRRVQFGFMPFFPQVPSSTEFKHPNGIAQPLTIRAAAPCPIRETKLARSSPIIHGFVADNAQTKEKAPLGERESGAARLEEAVVAHEPRPSLAPEAARVRHLDPKRYITIRKMKWI